MKRFIGLFVLAASINAAAQQTITFPSGDGLTITADLYVASDTLPYMLLLHQAGYSRGEYKETAKKFNHLGYNCLAVDLRSGGEVNGIKNMTHEEAVKNKKKTDYLDAEQDITAAIDYLYEKSKRRVWLVGSSYSASLALKLAVNNFKVAAVIAFSPGEYFGKKLKVGESISKLDKPVLVLCTTQERKDVNELMNGVISKKKTIFSPAVDGVHGSSSLWKANSNYHDYWIAVMMFVDKD
ncbi:MAG TPA: dienelactone hydrolase family protein [Bacteroidia bacterium]|jgi:dienelactone hydrolase